MTIVSALPASDQGVTETIESADDIAAYHKGLPHFRLDAVQTAPGPGPIKLWSVESRDSTMASVAMELPILGHAHVPDDEVVVAVITSAPKMAQWSGVELRPGMVLVYGSGAHHTGLSSVGVEFAYLTLRVPSFEGRTSSGTNLPAAGTVGIFQLIGGGKDIAYEMEAIACRAYSGGSPTAMSEDVEKLIGLVMHKHPVTTSRRLATSRLIVAECVRAVDARGGAATTIQEVLSAVPTSPRRLRQAFGDTYGVPPNQYLQLRVLNMANERLASNGSRCNSVTQVASDLGISHLGRFSQRYREVFGEHPSVTLARARSLGVDGVA